ncbi:MAG: hypothetical protein IPM74_19645 [Crocinitomicaceae bacterium]|nr:hypothetical protein [Crocinitomicaceae bacterium]
MNRIRFNSKTPNTTIIFLQADALFNQGKYLESIPVYQQALGVKPNDAYATNQIQEAERREKENQLMKLNRNIKNSYRSSKEI